jgi:hypothetical protein
VDGLLPRQSFPVPEAAKLQRGHLEAPSYKVKPQVLHQRLPATMEPDIRVEDYLDDKLQSTTDFEHLDDLLTSVELQRSQLQSQLDDASRELDEARRSSADRTDALAAQMAEFRALQESIDVRRQLIASSDAPDDAIRRLEPPMKQLRHVDLAYRYLLLLQDVEALRRAARSHLPQDPKAALEPYTRLRQLALHLRDLQHPADGAAVHLVAHVDAVAESLWGEMKKTMWDELEAVLAARGWPDVDPDSGVDEEWLQCFEKLVDLQAPRSCTRPPPSASSPWTSWPRYLSRSSASTFSATSPRAARTSLPPTASPGFWP